MSNSRDTGSVKPYLLRLGLVAAAAFLLLLPPVREVLHRDGLLSMVSSVLKGIFRDSATLPSSASAYSIKGVDVSYYQGNINWQQVKKHPAEFAFIKATQGRNRVDKYYNRNWKNAKKAGLIRGAYHFFTPSRNAEEQAANFIAQVKLEPGDLPPVLDVERTEGRTADEIREGVEIWLEKVEAEYGMTPILYTNYRFYQRYLEDHFDDYPIWIAHYTDRAPVIAHETGWTFWQHTETARVKGIRKKVDMNVYCGSLENLQSLCKR